MTTARAAGSPTEKGPVMTASSQTTPGRNDRVMEGHGSGSEIVQPRRLIGTDDDRFIERIETFSGCDEARDWALALKEELSLWQAGDLRWEEMSTKLLLSGPPGTGKSMFARSLCNSLQVPMFATSVSTWLEPVSPGNIVRRIKGAFAESVAHQPAILFIDGIGRRSDSNRDHAYYGNVVKPGGRWPE